MNNLLLRRRALMEGKSDNKEKFLYSDGHSWFVTGFGPTATMVFEYRYYADLYTQYGPHVAAFGNYFCPYINGYGDHLSCNLFNTTSTIYKHIFDLSEVVTLKVDNNTGNVYLNGDVVAAELPVGTPASSTTNLSIFTYNSGSNSNLSLVGGIAYFKIWENDVLIRDFRPTIRNNVAGMVDKVNNVFYPSITNTPFTIVEK